MNSEARAGRASALERVAEWSVVAAVSTVPCLIGVAAWWVSGNPALAAFALLGIPVIVAILQLGSRARRRRAVRLGSEIQRWGEDDLPGRLSIATSAELSPITRELNEASRRLRERMLDLAAKQGEADAILQSMTSGVIALDGEQRILRANLAAERLLGIEHGRGRGRLLQEVLRQPEIHALVGRAMREGDRREIECRLRSGANVHVRIEPLKQSASITGLLILLDDVTQIRRLESIRSDFAANVSHELRTPITNIVGYVATLEQTGFDDAAQARRFLEVIRHNAARLASIVDDVMALTRLEQEKPRVDARSPELPHASGDGNLPLQVAPLRPILDAAVALHSEFAAKKNIRIELRVEDDLAARVHPALLEQAVGNLVSNAVSYSPSGTCVTVAASRIPDGVEIAVIDQGPGIAREHHERIFERFYRVDRGRSRDVGGTGLGLAIVKHIAQAHGGSVTLQSAPGEGSTFRILLPKV
jgi:two-component system phosphate regulon sensor histidine kinase PhoR